MNAQEQFNKRNNTDRVIISAVDGSRGKYYGLDINSQRAFGIIKKEIVPPGSVVKSFNDIFRTKFARAQVLA